MAQEAFTFQALEPITVRNKREPVAVYDWSALVRCPAKFAAYLS